MSIRFSLFLPLRPQNSRRRRCFEDIGWHLEWLLVCLQPFAISLQLSRSLADLRLTVDFARTVLFCGRVPNFRDASFETPQVTLFDEIYILIYVFSLFETFLYYIIRKNCPKEDRQSHSQRQDTHGPYVLFKSSLINTWQYCYFRRPWNKHP